METSARRPSLSRQTTSCMVIAYARASSITLPLCTPSLPINSPLPPFSLYGTLLGLCSHRTFPLSLSASCGPFPPLRYTWHTLPPLPWLFDTYRDNAIAILSVLLPPPFALRHLFVTRHPAPSLAYRISSADGAQFSLRRALILQSVLLAICATLQAAHSAHPSLSITCLPAASRCDRYSSTIPEIALVTFPTKLPAASLLPPPAR